MKKIWFTSTIAIALLFISSCKDGDDAIMQSAEDNAQLETEYSQIYDVVGDLLSTNAKTKKTENNILIGDATVTFTDTTFDDGDGVDFIIDYGPLENGGKHKGIMCKDQRYRAGKIHVGINERLGHIPDTITIAISASNNYYFGNGTDMLQLTGNARLVHTSIMEYHVTVSDARLYRSKSSIATWGSEKTLSVTREAGEGWLGDEYTLSGTSSGISVTGEAFTVETLVPLSKHISYGCLTCFNYGEEKLTAGGKQYNINYDPSGEKVCDNKVTVSRDNVSKEITLW